MSKKVYSTSEAAEYLGLHVETLKYHMYDMGRISADHVIGGVLGFEKSTLDAFAQSFQSSDMTMREAAEYLGVNYTAIRYHVYTSKKLVPTGKRGKSHTFSVASVDELEKNLT